jgi:hypothetical protein
MACYRECSEVREDFCMWLFTSVTVQGGNYVALICGTYNEDVKIHVSLTCVQDGVVFIKPRGSDTSVN